MIYPIAGGILKVLLNLHMLNPVRTDFAKNRIDLKDKTLIDVGCGGGLLCENLAEHSKEVKGIDMSNEAIEIAKTHQTLKNLKIDYEEIALESLLKKSKKSMMYLPAWS